MALETGTYISDLVVTNPVGSTDPVSDLDGHDRLIKSTIKNTFPNVNGAVNPTPAEFNVLASVTQGTAAASKAVVLDASKDVTGINALTSTTITGTTINQGGNNVVDDGDIGSTVQAWDANLDQIAALAPTADNFIVGNGSAWTLETPANARTSLGLVIGTDVQAYDDNLNDIAVMTASPADGSFIVGNGTGFVLESAAEALDSIGIDGSSGNIAEGDIKWSAGAGLTSFNFRRFSDNANGYSEIDLPGGTAWVGMLSSDTSVNNRFWVYVPAGASTLNYYVVASESTTGDAEFQVNGVNTGSVISLDSGGGGLTNFNSGTGTLTLDASEKGGVAEFTPRCRNDFNEAGRVTRVKCMVGYFT